MSRELFKVYAPSEDAEDKTAYIELLSDSAESLLEFYHSPEAHPNDVTLVVDQKSETPKPEFDGDVSISELESKLRRPRNVGEVISFVGDGVISKSRQAALGLNLLLFS